MTQFSILRYSLSSIFLLVILITLTPNLNAQDSTYIFCEKNVFKYGSTGGSDCWGWVGPDGTEYAIMGKKTGVSFVNATTLTKVGSVEGATGGSCDGGSIWRDMTTYLHYCYVVSECSGNSFEGLQVIDLSFLPDSVHYLGSFPVNDDGDMTSHNISIDSTSGFAYVEGHYTDGKKRSLCTFVG